MAACRAKPNGFRCRGRAPDGAELFWPRHALSNNQGSYVTKGSAMKIPEGIRIPLIVLSLEAVLLTGAGLIFIVLVPH